MLKHEILKVIRKQHPDLSRNLGITRDFKIKILDRFVSIVYGVRRCGKSTIARQFLQGKKAYYLNFEDIALADFQLKDFGKLEELFEEEYGGNGFFFFDEIQNIAGWERYVRNLVDKGSKVIITGSNASMLSRELGTRLTGRHITKVLYPFSYNEYLRLRKDKHSLPRFRKYLSSGGFPEYLKTEDPDVLRNLFQDIFFRDVLVRNDIRSESALRSMLLFLLSNIGKEISYNKLRSYIGVQSTNTVIQFMEGFEDAYLMFSVKKFDYSVKKQMINPKKIYCIDNAIIGTNAFSFSENKGRMLENLVFVELLRRGKEVFYYKNKSECDFVLREGNRIMHAIQVCYRLNEDNYEREIAGLVEAVSEHKLKKGLVLTFEQDDEISVKNTRIKVLPVWKWLRKTV